MYCIDKQCNNHIVTYGNHIVTYNNNNKNNNSRHIVTKVTKVTNILHNVCKIHILLVTIYKVLNSHIYTQKLGYCGYFGYLCLLISFFVKFAWLPVKIGWLL
jgi:hypothetical protein